MSGREAVLAVPVLGVVVLVATFWVSLRTVRGGAPPENARVGEGARACRSWWRAHWWKMASAYALMVVLAFERVTLAVTGALAVSMIGLAFLVGRLGKLGLANRGVVASVCWLWLFVGAVMSSQLTKWLLGHEGHTLDEEWIPALLVWGAGLCAVWLPSHGRRLARPMKTFLVGLCVFWGAAHAALALWPAKPNLDELARATEGFDRAPNGTASWEQWAVVADWAKRRGAAPDLTRPHSALARIERDNRVTAYALASAVELGVVTEQELHTRLATKETADDVRELLAPRKQGAPIVWLAERDWLVRALADTKRLTPKETDVVERRLLASWPKPNDFESLETMLRIDQLLEKIGRPMDRAPRRESVFVALRAAWVECSPPLRPTAGFANDPARGDSAEGSSTNAAVELMMRYGVPDDLDLGRVGSFLAYEGKPFTPFTERTWDQLFAGCVLDKLERGLDWPARGPLDWILSERLVLGTLLVVLLCVYAVVRSPVVPIRQAGSDQS